MKVEVLPTVVDEVAKETPTGVYESRYEKGRFVYLVRDKAGKLRLVECKSDFLWEPITDDGLDEEFKHIPNAKLVIEE